MELCGHINREPAEEVGSRENRTAGTQKGRGQQAAQSQQRLVASQSLHPGSGRVPCPCGCPFRSAVMDSRLLHPSSCREDSPLSSKITGGGISVRTQAGITHGNQKFDRHLLTLRNSRPSELLQPEGRQQMLSPPAAGGISAVDYDWVTVTP